MNNPFEILAKKLDRIEKSIEAIQPKEEDKWMSIEDLQSYLPGSISKDTIYQWTSKLLIPHTKPAGKLWFKKSKIDQWMYEGELKTNLQIRKENSMLKTNHK